MLLKFPKLMLLKLVLSRLVLIIAKTERFVKVPVIIIWNGTSFAVKVSILA